MLRGWKRQAESRARLTPGDGFPGNGKLTSQEEEIRQLRRDVEILKQERDFLKKRRRTLRASRAEVRVYRGAPGRGFGFAHVPSAWGFSLRLLRGSAARAARTGTLGPAAPGENSLRLPLQQAKVRQSSPLRGAEKARGVCCGRVQYASGDYRELLRQHGILCSTRRKGNCWDNAVAESFFATLAWELIEESDGHTREQVKQDLFEYLEIWYNRQRRHSSLGYRTPAGYEETLALTRSAA